MRLRRCRQHVGDGKVINVDRGVDDVVAALNDVGCMPVAFVNVEQQRLEDFEVGVVREEIDREDVEVAEETSIHVLPRSADESTSGDDHHVVDEDLRRVFRVEPVLLVKVLTDELDRRLSSVNVFGGHVHVVDEQDALEAFRRSEHSLPLLDQLRQNQLLNLVCGDLGGEGHERWAVLVLRQLHQIVLNVKRLSGSRWADHQERPLILEVEVEEMRVASGVDGRHLNRNARIDLHVAHQVSPLFPRALLLEDVNVVDDQALGRNGDFDFADFRRDRRVPDLREILVLLAIQLNLLNIELPRDRTRRI